MLISLFNLGFMITFYVSRRSGGDKIYGVFDNQFPAALKRLQFDKNLSMENIRKLIIEADGYQPHLIAPEQGYRRLIEFSLTCIKGPAEAAVDAVCFIDSPVFSLGISTGGMIFPIFKTISNL